MEIIREFLLSLTDYLKAQVAPMSFLEYCATVICPIISTLAIVVGGGFALIKYRAEKNYEINLQILNEVYLPLYSYLVKQETFRYIACPNHTWQDNPILEVHHTKTTTTFGSDGVTTTQSKTPVCGCTRETLLEICDNANLGLASTELVNILNAYKVACHISSESTEIQARSTAALLQTKLELALREEIIKGYNYYHKKLTLHDTPSQVFKVNNEQIELIPKFSKAEIDQMAQRIQSISKED